MYSTAPLKETVYSSLPSVYIRELSYASSSLRTTGAENKLANTNAAVTSSGSLTKLTEKRKYFLSALELNLNVFYSPFLRDD